MEVVSSRPRTIKQKKESLIHSRTSQHSTLPTPFLNDKETPIKPSSKQCETAVKGPRVPSLYLTLTEQKSQNSLEKSESCLGLGRSLRRIKSISELETLHGQKIVSKSKYRFKANDNLAESLRSTVDSNKKQQSEKIPINILAIQQSVQQKSNRAMGREKSMSSRYSQSKVIKGLIIHYPENTEVK